MPKGKKDVLRRSGRKSAKKATAKSLRNRYITSHKGLKVRIRRKPTAFTPCQSTNTYNLAWAPPTVGITAAGIQLNQSIGQDTKKGSEALGESGAKWYVANQLLRKNIEDKAAPFQAGYFYTFSNAHVFDIVYVDAITNDVYVIEAKGTQYPHAPGLISRQNGKTQGNWDYLDEVAAEMAASGDPLKTAAASRIINAPAGKLHYVGVHTTWSTDASGKVTAHTPTAIFNKNR